MNNKKKIYVPGPSWIQAVREEHGLTKAQAAEMCHVTVATWRRWEKGSYPMNPCIFHYWLSALEERVIPRGGAAGKHWQGWKIQGKQLLSPDGEEFGPYSILGSAEQRKAQREVVRHAQKVRKQARNGLNEAGGSWEGWRFEGGFLVSPEGRKITADDVRLVLSGFDAMLDISQNGNKGNVSSLPDLAQLSKLA